MSEHEKKEIMETIETVLKTTEMIKSMIKPFLEGNEKAIEILELHDKAIKKLMEDLIGLKEDHVKIKKELEITENKYEDLEISLISHLKEHEVFIDKSLTLNYEIISEIYKKTFKGGEIKQEEITYIEKSIDIFPQNDFLYGLNARILNIQGKKEEALDFINKYLKKFPKSAWLWYNKGLITIETNEEETFDALEKALEYIPESENIKKHNVLYTKTMLLRKLEKYEEALTIVEDVIKYNPSCPMGWTLKAELLLIQNIIPDALGCIERSLEIKKDVSKTWFIKGEVLSLLGPDHFEDAIDCYQKVMELESIDYNVALSYFRIGKLLMSMKKLDDALENFNKGLEYNPDDPCAWCDKGVILNWLGRNEEVLESFQKSISLDPTKRYNPDCIQVFLDIGIVLTRLGRIEEAKEWLEKTLEIDPNYEPAKELLKELKELEPK